MLNLISDLNLAGNFTRFSTLEEALTIAGNSSINFQLFKLNLCLILFIPILTSRFCLLSRNSRKHQMQTFLH